METPTQNRSLLEGLRAVAASRHELRAQWPRVKTPLKRAALWLSLFEVMKMLELIPLKFFFDQAAQKNYEFAWAAALMIFSSSVVSSLLRNRLSNWRNHLIHEVRAAVWPDGYRKMLELSTEWHVAHGTGEKEALIPKNLERVQQLFESLCFDAVPSAVRILVTTAALFWLALPYGVVGLFTFAAFIFVLWTNEKPMERMRREYHDGTVVLEAKGSELSQLWRTIRSFGLEERTVGGYQSTYRQFTDAEHTRHHEWANRSTRFDVVLDVSTGLSYAIALVSFIYFGKSVGDMVLGTAWMARMMTNYNRIIDFEHRRQRGTEALRSLIAIMLTKPSVGQAAGAERPTAPSGAITLTGVSFSYPGNSRTALWDVNINVPAHRMVAVMGRSGSGKTTLAALLAREYDPTAGTIHMDGVPLQQIDYQWYRGEAIAVVHQHTELFTGTVADNLRIVRPTASDEELHQAAKLAHADEFIQKLEGGYATLIGENGIRLSGGQRQRLAIARALLRRPKLLILDEATSALDAESQAQVQAAIDGLIADRSFTMVVIAHRFSTLEAADLVVVMDDGKIVEQGTHDELKAHGQLYQKLRALEEAGALADDE